MLWQAKLQAWASVLSSNYSAPPSSPLYCLQEPEAKVSGRGRGRGSSKARGSGRGTASGRGGRGLAKRRPSGRGAAAVIDSDSDGERHDAAGDGIGQGAAGAAATWQFEPVAEAAEEFEALMAAGGSEDAAGIAEGGSGGKASGRAGGKAKGSGRGKASKRGRAEEVVVLDGSCDAELVPAGGAAGAAGAADEAAAVAAAVVDELWDGPGSFGGSDDDADLLLEYSRMQPPAAGVPKAGSPMPAGQLAPPLQQREQEPRERPAVQHQLLFPEASGAVLRWDRAGRLAIAPPPTLEALLAAVGAPAAAPNLSQSSGSKASQDAGTALPKAGEAHAAPVPTPPPSQQQPVLPPLLAEDGLVLRRRAQPGGAIEQGLLRFDDPAAAHRWAFLAAAGAAPAGQQPAEPAAHAADAAAVAQAAAPAAAPAPAPAAAAGKKSGKVSKPRKRKPAAAAAAAEGQADAAAAEAQPKKRKVRALGGFHMRRGELQLMCCGLPCQSALSISC